MVRLNYLDCRGITLPTKMKGIIAVHPRFGRHRPNFPRFEVKEGEQATVGNHAGLHITFIAL